MTISYLFYYMIAIVVIVSILAMIALFLLEGIRENEREPRNAVITRDSFTLCGVAFFVIWATLTGILVLSWSSTNNQECIDTFNETYSFEDYDAEEFDLMKTAYCK